MKKPFSSFCGCLLFASGAALAQPAGTAAWSELFPASLAPVPARRLSAAPVSVVEKGEARAVIVLPEKSYPFQYTIHISPQSAYADRYRTSVGELAASEIQRLVRLATGATLPIARVLPEKGNAIVFSYDATLPPEGYRITSGDGRIAIACAVPGKGGCADNGLYAPLFGAFDFLERTLGVRYYYPGEDGTFVPSLRDFAVAAFTYEDHPRFNRRQLTTVAEGRGTFVGAYPDHTLHMLHLRNGGNGALGANYSFCHTPYDLSREPGTVPSVPGCGRLPVLPCYLAQGTQDAFMNSLQKFYAGEKSPAWFGPSGKRYSQEPASWLVPFGPPDVPLVCRCPLCAPYRDDDKPFHAQGSRLYGKIVETYAKNVKAAYPDKLFHILPYYDYVEMPKGLTLPDNCVATVCLMYGHSTWHDDYIRENSMAWIRDWSKATGRKVYIYGYPMWPGVNAFLQYARGLKRFVTDVEPYVEGFQFCRLHNWNNEFLIHYVMYKLMWNPGVDPLAIEREMTEKFYGKAGPAMARLFDRVSQFQTRLNSKNCPEWLDIGPFRAGRTPFERILAVTTPEDFAVIRKAVDEAKAAVAPGSVEARRVDFFVQRVEELLAQRDVYSAGFKTGEIQLAALSTAMKLDGEEDAEWAKLPSYSLVKAEAHHTREPDEKTSFKAAWNPKAKYLYFFLRMQEPTPDKLVYGKPVWAGDNVEFLIEYAPGRIYQIAINAKGSYFDATIGKPFVNRRGAPEWTTKIGKREWTMEIKIPVSLFGDGIEFGPDHPWKMNVCRGRFVEGMKTGRITRFSTRYAPDNADEKAFSKLEFR